MRRPTARETGRLALLAATGLAGFNLCVVGALGHAEPPAVGVIVGAAPILIAVGAPLAARRVRPLLVLAAAAVVGGIALVEGGGRTSLLGVLLAAGALTGEVAFTLLAAPLLPRLGPVGVSVHSCLIGGVLLAAGTPVLAAMTGSPALPRPSPAQVGAVAYLTLVVTAVAFIAWYTCVARLGADRAGLLVGLMPVGTYVMSLLLRQTTVTTIAVLGVCLVTAGVAGGVAGGVATRLSPARLFARWRRSAPRWRRSAPRWRRLAPRERPARRPASKAGSPRADSPAPPRLEVCRGGRILSGP